MTLAGVPLEGIYPESYWVAALLGDVIQDSTEQSLEEALETTLRMLASHTLFLEEFRRDGGTLNITVGIFGPRNFGLEFSPALLCERGLAGLEIGLDVYPGGPNDVRPDSSGTPD